MKSVSVYLVMCTHFALLLLLILFYFFLWIGSAEITHIVNSGDATLLHILRQAQQNVTAPKVGELTKNYSLTYGNFIHTIELFKLTALLEMVLWSYLEYEKIPPNALAIH